MSPEGRLRLALVKSLPEGGVYDPEGARAILASLNNEPEVAALASLVGELLATNERLGAERARIAKESCTQQVVEEKVAKRRELVSCQESAARAQEKLNAELTSLQEQLTKAKGELDAMKRIDLRRR